MSTTSKFWGSFGMTFAVLLLLAGVGWSEKPGQPIDAEYVPGELLVKFLDESPATAIQDVAQSVGAKHLKTFPVIGVRHWRLGKGVSVKQALGILSKSPSREAIEYAEPNYIVHASEFPYDPLRNDLWGLHNLGQTGGTLDADIDALEAWVAETGSDAVVVGCIDSGIDYNHEDLNANIWTNPGEIPDNGKDDDDNGYIDDWRGWDFCNDDNDPIDDADHGSHTAGTIGAAGDNNIGITGVNWTVKLMPLKFLDACGSGTIADAVEAVLYAAWFKDELGENVVRITNNSYGGKRSSRAMKEAIASSGALFVAAAGNQGKSRKVYPAGDDLDNIVSVAATDHNDELASFSNYGADWVDLGAPGVDVLSTARNNGYEYMDGTSMAAPHVAGVAALLLADNPSLTIDELKATILDNVDLLPSLEGMTLTGGRLNARAALGADEFPEDNVQPSPVTDLAAGEVTTTSITLTWTATGDDGIVDMAYLYDIRYSDAPINGDNWNDANQVAGEPIPQTAGSPEIFTLTGLTSGVTYYMALKVSDEVGNCSDLSNVPGATTEISPWAIDIVDSGAGFGYGAHAYDGSGNPAIGYPDYDNDDVKFAHWNGTSWITEIVDPGVVAHGGVDIAFDPNDGNPSLSYTDYDRGDLKFAHWNGSSWDIVVIEARTVIGWEPSLEYDPSRNPSIAYCGGKAKTKGLKLARFVSGSWETELVDPVNMGIKHYVSLAYDADGNPAIAYSDDIDPDILSMETLKFARWNGASWDIEIVETGVFFYGMCASLAYDAAGNPTIVHGYDEVRFLSSNGSGWNLEIVDGEHSEGTSMAYSPDGTAFVSYSKFAGSDRWVSVARRNEPDNWETDVVEILDRATSTSVKFDEAGNPSLSYCDHTNDYLKFAQKTGDVLAGGARASEHPRSGRSEGTSKPVLLQNSPNPCRNETMIRFNLAQNSHATLTIYDATGRTVTTLFDEELAAGAHTAEWKTDVPSGIYFYRLTAGDFTDIKKMILLR